MTWKGGERKLNKKIILVAILCLILAASISLTNRHNVEIVYADLPADGDSWTENTASSWFYDTGRGSLVSDSAVKQVGSYSLRATRRAQDGGWHYMQYPAGRNAGWNLNGFSGLRFYARQGVVRTFYVRLCTNDGNYYQRAITLSSASAWQEQNVPVGSTSSGWTSVGAPNWGGINYLEFGLVAGAGESLWIDGVRFYTASFTVSASPSSQTVTIPPQQQPTYTVTVTSMGGFNSPVTLSVSGLPSGVTASFDPSSVTPPSGGSVTSTLTITVPETTSSGTYPLTISGTSGANTATTTATLIVRGPEVIPFQVRAGATQIVITIMWVGSGTATVRLTDQSNSVTYEEAMMTIYEKIIVDVAADGSKTYTYVKRATLTIAQTPVPQNWILSISLTGIGAHTVNIEIT